MDNLTITDLLAFWGAILSTVAFAWNIFRDREDKGKLKLEAIIGKIIPTHADKNFLIITLTNTGRRPLRVLQLAGLWKVPKNGKKAFVCLTQHLPKTLNEGEDLVEHNDALVNELSNIKRLRAKDSVGREWDLCPKTIKKLAHQQHNTSNEK